MKKVICLSGHAESGKTTAAKIIKERLEKAGNRVVIVPFANYLKFIAKQYYGWSGIKDADGRHLLQYLGTDVVRKKNPNFWVQAVLDFVMNFGNDFDYVICDDTRFSNEIKLFAQYNIEVIAIRVERPNYENSLTEEQRQHPSETALDYFQFDIYLRAETGCLPEVIERDIFNSAEGRRMVLQ